MRFVRRVERVLESVVDQVAGRVFPGDLQPDDLAGRVVRVVDLGVSQTRSGPSAPNRVVVGVHPDDLSSGIPVAVLERALAHALEEEAADRGWRLDGPAEVRLQSHHGALRGVPEVHAERHPGPRPQWGTLRLGHHVVPLTDNRVVVGRSDQVDARIPDDSISRTHALVWREGGKVLVRDLGSSNGTRVDGRPADGPTVLATTSVVAMGALEGRVVTT